MMDEKKRKKVKKLREKAAELPYKPSTPEEAKAGYQFYCLQGRANSPEAWRIRGWAEAKAIELKPPEEIRENGGSE